MHGVRRDQVTEVSAQKLAEQEALANKWKQLWDRMIVLKSAGALTWEALEVTRELATMNPDCYSLWNYRKRILTHKLDIPSYIPPKPTPTPAPTPTDDATTITTATTTTTDTPTPTTIIGAGETGEVASEAPPAALSTPTPSEPAVVESSTAIPSTPTTAPAPSVDTEPTPTPTTPPATTPPKLKPLKMSLKTPSSAEKDKEPAQQEAEDYDKETRVTLADKKRLLWRERAELSNGAIRHNSKSYHCWYHRMWVMHRIVQLYADIESGREYEDSEALAREQDADEFHVFRRESGRPHGVDWAYELELTTQFLRIDSRNFHCWGYRRFVLAEGKPATEDDELAYTERKIGEGEQFFGVGAGNKEKQERSMSNYSAWHVRSAILANKLKKFREAQGTDAEAAAQAKKLILDEFNLLENIVVSHNGQSPWLYHRWLVANVDEEDKKSILERELEICTEIIKIDAELSPDAPPPKWALLTKVFLLLGLEQVNSGTTTETEKEGGSADKSNSGNNSHRKKGGKVFIVTEEVRGLLHKLQEIDPFHKAFYADMLQHGIPASFYF
eukprot:TRINITY_DN944_c0_g1_i1.p1 TRINITY_DN944_c0_g1~~TRINITY_DN944_c0_g1_i1.p1  ORF type:complete len:558 (-),score=161.50 TRINITY_DN944_c0_g1_i1:58-1731(-)